MSLELHLHADFVFYLCSTHEFLFQRNGVKLENVTINSPDCPDDLPCECCIRCSVCQCASWGKATAKVSRVLPIKIMLE